MNDETRSKGLVAAQVVNVAEFVSYQDGSVVSREILKKPTGTVTVFAFDAGQGLSEHTAPFDALVQVLEGRVEITIAGEAHRLSGGQIILMPAHQPHALKALERFKMMLTMVR
jgi:quercetin dioxygenase-like cupin family protein